MGIGGDIFRVGFLLLSFLPPQFDVSLHSNHCVPTLQQIVTGWQPQLLPLRNGLFVAIRYDVDGGCVLLVVCAPTQMSAGVQSFTINQP